MLLAGDDGNNADSGDGGCIFNGVFDFEIADTTS